ncbi:hypothetical protein INT47_001107 [Mucor saturninus]|uniref:Uncharacterized protein n=1 Tax=Mucor saturninus TaxID=64648 RepID=A0A8H7RQB4_9FUNG|nr:hypothetical protein INT47_001107 [Mucor saturninus]
MVSLIHCDTGHACDFAVDDDVVAVAVAAAAAAVVVVVVVVVVVEDADADADADAVVVEVFLNFGFDKLGIVGWYMGYDDILLGGVEGVEVGLSRLKFRTGEVLLR